MKKILLLIFPLFCVCISVQAQRCAQPFKIVVLGSSTSAGTGPTSSDSAYVNRYRKFLIDSVNAGCTVVNLAIGGATTYKMQPSGYVPPSNRSSFPVDTARNITKAISLAPDAMLINYPSNDASSSFTFQEQKDNFLRVMALADSARIPVWITTTQPRNFSDTARLNSLMRMRDWINTTYGPDRNIDFWTGIAKANGTIDSIYNSGDGVHLNNAGHRILNNRVKARGIHTYLCSKILTVNILPEMQRPILFPNPVSSELQVRFPSDIPGDIRCDVYDMTGRKMNTALKTVLPGKDYRITGFNTLPAGVYYIAIYADNRHSGALVTKTP